MPLLSPNEKETIRKAPCEGCGATPPPSGTWKCEVHRIIPARLGGLYTRENVKGLCPGCHAAADGNGRPSGKGRRRHRPFQVWLNAEERTLLNESAEAEGLTASGWLRTRLEMAAEAMGLPMEPPSEVATPPLTERLIQRVNPADAARWRRQAKAAGMTLSEAVRVALDRFFAVPEPVRAPKVPDSRLPVPPPTDKLAAARSLLGGDRQATLAKMRGEPVESRAPVGRAPKAPAEVLREVRATAQANPGLNPVVLAERFVARYPEHAEAIRAAVAGLEDTTA